MQNTSPQVLLRIRTEFPKVRGANRTFVRDFTIGRGPGCDVRVESGLVSRVHATITYDEGQWWVRDENSTNGTFLGGESVDRAPLPAEAELQLGHDGPIFTLSIEGGSAATVEDATHMEGHAQEGGALPEVTEHESQSAHTDRSEEEVPLKRAGASSLGGPHPGRAGAASRPDPSVSQYVEYYFSGDADHPAGEHTQMLRQAYQKVHGEQKKKYTWAIIGALVISMLLGAYAVVQHMRNEQFEEQAAQMFATIKEVDIQIAQLQQLVEEREDTDLATALNEARQRRQRLNEQYSNKVEELGLYREATEREREIYRVARIFRESEFSIPAGFVRRVKDKIENFWLQEPHRSDYVEAIERAQENGYIAPIVETMQAYGLPPEFFYLALQESKFLDEAVGPPTRHGIAKGMWQFIPRTAERFGLRVGPREGTAVCEAQDERCDFRKATEAAARYLRFIYSTKAQASGLLVIASYNWGEHRVVDKLGRIPQPQRIPDAALEGIPENPQSRNYWRFLDEYSDRMPEQTKDYVLKIFAAAVIGQNPRLFGFSFDNPLLKHIERAAGQSAVS